MTSIEIIVSPSGETRIETKGFTGAARKDASRSLEQALGAVQCERLTTEFHQQPVQDFVKNAQG
jgi:hypothetical protein